MKSLAGTEHRNDNGWPVSVKGVLSWGGDVVVLRNEREEWELPGGRLEIGDESPQSALKREFAEELSLDVEVGRLLDTWIYDVASKRVLILTYLVTVERPADLRHSHEHTAVDTFKLDQLRSEVIPVGYLQSIELAEGAGAGPPKFD